MIDFLSSIGVVEWVLILGFLACLRYLPVLLRDMFVPDRNRESTYRVRNHRSFIARLIITDRGEV